MIQSIGRAINDLKKKYRKKKLEKNKNKVLSEKNIPKVEQI